MKYIYGLIFVLISNSSFGTIYVVYSKILGSETLFENFIEHLNNSNGVDEVMPDFLNKNQENGIGLLKVTRINNKLDPEYIFLEAKDIPENKKGALKFFKHDENFNAHSDKYNRKRLRKFMDSNIDYYFFFSHQYSGEVTIGLTSEVFTEFHHNSIVNKDNSNRYVVGKYNSEWWYKRKISGLNCLQFPDLLLCLHTLDFPELIFGNNIPEEMGPKNLSDFQIP